MILRKSALKISMEFPTLGEQCQDSDCRQSDFLPLRCACGAVFCRDHYTQHCLATGCGLAAPAPRSNAPPAEVFRCASTGCRSGALHEMLCPKCRKHFCIEHRFHPECPEIDEETLAAKREEFAAPRRQFQKVNVPLQQQITENIRKALQSSAKVKTASKIHLMRVKQKAIGPKTVPVADRAYFSILKPKNSSPKAITIINDSTQLIPIESLNLDPDIKDSIAVFISRKWTLGRAIDNICDTCSVTNENNKPNANKIRLFRQLDGYCIGAVKMDVEISELVSREILVEGDKLVVEYISSDELLTACELAQVFLKLPVECLAK